MVCELSYSPSMISRENEVSYRTGRSKAESSPHATVVPTIGGVRCVNSPRFQRMSARSGGTEPVGQTAPRSPLNRACGAPAQVCGRPRQIRH